MYPFETLRFIDTEPTMAEICASENILLAYAKVRLNNGCAGVDGVTVERFDQNVEENLVHLQEELLSGAYQPAPLLRFYVDKGDGSQRALSIPTVRDRIVQQAITAVLTPKLDATFEPSSYGYRKGKGRKQAIAEMIRLRDAGYQYVVDADIADYFDNVDHWILIQRVADLVPEESVARLVAMLLTSEVDDGQQRFTLRKGLPQGSPLSPLLSNLYLDLFDKVISERGYHLIRYVDDFVILERHLASAQQALQLAQYLLTQLKLSLKAEKTAIVTFGQGFRYLGVFFLGQNVHTMGKDNLKLPPPPRASETDIPQSHFAYPIPESGNGLPPRPSEGSGKIGRTDGGVRSSEPSPFQPPLPAPQFALSEPAVRDAFPDEWGLSPDAQVALNPDFLGAEAFAVPRIGEEKPHPPAVDSTQTHTGENTPSPTHTVWFPSVAPEIQPEPPHDFLTQQLFAMQQAIELLRADIRQQQGAVTPDEPPLTKGSQDQGMGTSRLLSTLYLHEQGSTLSLSEKRFIVKLEKTTLLEVPAMKIAQIVIFGQCQVTTPAIDFCLKAGVPICFLSQHGSYYGRLAPPTAKQVLLQQRQFLTSANHPASLKLAKAFVEGKIYNQRILLQRRQRRIQHAELSVAVDVMAEMLVKSAQATTLDELRGYEGNASARYFGVFGLLLDDAFSFSRRIKHPPTDPVNALLSFGYTLLFQNIYSLVEAHSLHPYCGHLHALRDGHPALVSDLIEEFRALVVDPLVLYLLNSHIIKADDFEPVERSEIPIYRNEPGESPPMRSGQADHRSGKQDASIPCRLTSAARKTFVQQFEAKMQSQVTHPPTGYTVDYRRCIDLQITQLVGCLRGEREGYLPMKGKA